MSTITETLQKFVDRIEAKEQDRAVTTSDLKCIYEEAKVNDLNIPALKQVIKERKLSSAERAQKESILDKYRSALGMLK
jgi:uncharacterized protein (UPF0335 family)